MRDLRETAFFQLTLARLREYLREPSALFWTFGFPVLLSVALGLAFRNRGPERVQVGVLDGTDPGVTATVEVLEHAGLGVRRLAPAEVRERLRAGKVALV